MWTSVSAKLSVAECNDFVSWPIQILSNAGACDFEQDTFTVTIRTVARAVEGTRCRYLLIDRAIAPRALQYMVTISPIVQAIYSTIAPLAGNKYDYCVPIFNAIHFTIARSGMQYAWLLHLLAGNIL